MYVDVVPNRSSPPAVLLRESRREGNKIRKRTIANISHWPAHQVDSLRRLLKGERLVGLSEAFIIEQSLPHGHVAAVLGTIRSIGLEGMIGSRRCRERDLVVAMIVEQILHHGSKLADTRTWHATSLAEELEVGDADANELYAALDWLLARQPQIEKKLGARHLSEGSTVFYDVTSSYYEGRTCPLARWGHSRDRKQGLPIIVYGTLADSEGRPVSVDVYAGNTADCATVAEQVHRLTERFALSRVVLVGDRGMLTQTRIEDLKQHPGLGWISALRSGAIRALIEKGQLESSLFDTDNLAEITSADYPNERLIACFNPLLADERARNRRALLEMTEARLHKIKAEVERRTKSPLSKEQIGLKVGKVLNRFKMGKHFKLSIEEGSFSFTRREEQIKQEQQLDGIYIVRTNVDAEALGAGEAVRQYKSLSQVERIYRTVKGLDILIRPVRHRSEARVRAHIFLCMLAYYVQWHMRKRLAPVLFDDEQLDELRSQRHPVAKAEPSESAKRKKNTLVTEAGLPVHSFTTLLAALATLSRCRCRLASAGPETQFVQLAEGDALHRKVFELLEVPYPVR